MSQFFYEVYILSNFKQMKTQKKKFKHNNEDLEIRSVFSTCSCISPLLLVLKMHGKQINKENILMKIRLKLSRF